jgi:formate hydrogenlyase subunit 4
MGTSIFIPVLKTVILVVMAPFFSGFIKKVKNNIRMRKGAGVLQPYFDLIKLFGKDEVVPENSSWIFSAAPYAAVAVMATVIFYFPVPGVEKNLPGSGGLIMLFFLLSLSRFFTTLAGLDAGSAFGGMGSSRDVFIASLAEPAVILVVFVIGVNNVPVLNQPAAAVSHFKISLFVAAISLLLITLAETGRIPVDNQETHLELTMIHEAMILEYSGRSLALMELAVYLKQTFFFLMLAYITPPYGLLSAGPVYQGLAVPLIFFLKIPVLCVLMALIEISFAKIRLFKAPDFLGLAFVAALAALIFAIGGW